MNVSEWIQYFKECEAAGHGEKQVCWASVHPAQYPIQVEPESLQSESGFIDISGQVHYRDCIVIHQKRDREVGIEFLSLPVRVYNALKRANINSVSDLMECSSADLLQLPGFGGVALLELKRAMKARGFLFDGLAYGGGAMNFDIPPGTRQATCKSCHAVIYWIRTDKGKSMPVNPDGSPHWATCPDADKFKKGKKE